MFLITRELFEEKYQPNNHLSISNYDRNLFETDVYYFRLAALSINDKPVQFEGPTVLRPGKSITVFSLESFCLSQRVFSEFFGTSLNAKKRLLLLCGHIIHHRFEGSLEVVLVNAGDEDIVLHEGMIIGKAVFFDISDSHASAILNVHSDDQLRVWNLRKEAGEKIDGWQEKTIDTEAPKDYPITPKIEEH